MSINPHVMKNDFRWDTPLTGEGTILGTLQYMAPEQLEGGEAVGGTEGLRLPPWVNWRQSAA